MKMTVVNKRIKVGDIKVSGVGSSSLVLVGDSEVIASSSYFDTPEDSLLFGKPSFTQRGRKEDEDAGQEA